MQNHAEVPHEELSNLLKTVAGELQQLNGNMRHGLSRALQNVADNTLYSLYRRGMIPAEGAIYQKSFLEELSGAYQEVMRDIHQRLTSGKIDMAQAQKEIIEVFQRIGSGAITIVSELAQTMLPHIGKLAAICVAAYGSVIGLRILKAYLIMYMNQPKLLRQVLHPGSIKQTLKNLYYTQETKAKVQYVIDMAKNVVANPSRATFENIMLWGDPGTGKTAVVQIIAKEADMTVFITSGGDFAKLKGKDLEQIDAMFRQARENRGWIFRRPVIIFIDEMEELFGSRARANLSEDARNVLTKLLVEFSTPSNQILLIGATNRPEDLDEAMFRRMPQQIEIGLPDQKGRKEILRLYIDKLFLKDSQFSKADIAKIRALFTEALLEKLAASMGDIAPAEIEDAVIRFKNRSLIYNKGIPTLQIIEAAMKDKLEQLRARKEGFVRTSSKQQLAAA
jgi:ATPase family AAA domain-containing protein 3A/B